MPERRKAPHPWATLGATPPPPGATRELRLRFVRDLQLRALGLCVVAGALLATTGLTLAIIAAVAGVAIGVINVVWLTVRIARADASRDE